MLWKFIINEYFIISDQRSVYRRHNSLQDKMLGSRYGWLETNSNDTPIKVVLVSNRYFINEWVWFSKWNTENAHKNMRIFSKSVSFFLRIYVYVALNWVFFLPFFSKIIIEKHHLKCLLVQLLDVISFISLLSSFD